MDTLEELASSALIIFDCSSVFLTYKIMGDFFCNAVLPVNVPSISFILAQLPNKRLKLFALTSVLLGSAFIVLVGTVLNVFMIKNDYVLATITVISMSIYLMLILNVHLIKRYEQEAIHR